VVSSNIGGGAVYLVTHQILITPLCTLGYKELVAVQGLSLLSLKTNFLMNTMGVTLNH